MGIDAVCFFEIRRIVMDGAAARLLMQLPSTLAGPVG